MQETPEAGGVKSFEESWESDIGGWIDTSIVVIVKNSIAECGSPFKASVLGAGPLDSPDDIVTLNSIVEQMAGNHANETYSGRTSRPKTGASKQSFVWVNMWQTDSSVKMYFEPTTPAAYWLCGWGPLLGNASMEILILRCGGPPTLFCDFYRNPPRTERTDVDESVGRGWRGAK